MKKTLALLMGIGTVVSIAFAQNPGDKKSHVLVTNVSNIALNVICERTENSLADSSINYFCWDVCFIPSVSVSGVVEILPGTTSPNHIGYYNAGGGTGVSTISYCFYDNDNPIDSACVIILYTPESPDDSVYASVDVGLLVGLDEYGNVRQNKILDIYPNPAKTNATVSYSLENGSRSAHIVVRNLLGEEVMEVPLKGSTGKVIFPVSQLNSGLYFYSMVVNGQVESTQRLVVK
ncbi:MAG: hypothetical protein COB85_03350 [Bacteroidetes bacterium]|nr:MAG: hypothetical protein COB85_03350 [Bacteroidota bacterium]